MWSCIHVIGRIRKTFFVIVNVISNASVSEETCRKWLLSCSDQLSVSGGLIFVFRWTPRRLRVPIYRIPDHCYVGLFRYYVGSTKMTYLRSVREWHMSAVPSDCINDNFERRTQWLASPSIPYSAVEFENSAHRWHLVPRCFSDSPRSNYCRTPFKHVY